MGADRYAEQPTKTAEELAAEAAAFLASREPSTEPVVPPTETKTYGGDGTDVTGPGPLPELSPEQLDANDKPAETATSRLDGLRNLIGCMVQEELVRVQSGCYGPPTMAEIELCGQFHDLLTHAALRSRCFNQIG